MTRCSGIERFNIAHSIGNFFLIPFDLNFNYWSQNRIQTEARKTDPHLSSAGGLGNPWTERLFITVYALQKNVKAYKDWRCYLIPRQ